MFILNNNCILPNQLIEHQPLLGGGFKYFNVRPYLGTWSKWVETTNQFGTFWKFDTSDVDPQRIPNGISWSFYTFSMDRY